jgi:hypothetical protein
MVYDSEGESMKRMTSKIIILVWGLSSSCIFSQQQLNDINYLNEESPGFTAQLFGKGIISTKDYEHGSPAFSPSYEEIYWGVRMNQEPGREIIIYVKRVENGWSEPKNPSFSVMGNGDLYPVFSKNGKDIYFTSDRPAASNPKIMNRCIWKVRRNGKEWSEPEIVGFDSLDIYGLSISPKGTLYFMAQTLKDRGTMLYDIYYSTLENGKYNRPVKIGYPVSTEHYEDGPFISNDEKLLLFESNRSGGEGKLDLYISSKTEDGIWSVPKNLGKLINTESSERFPYISPDGKYFFFGSDRNGNYDIYWISASIIYGVVTN